MGEIILYTNPRSRGATARWMLEETGVPYEQVLLDYGTTMKAPAYLAINPMGKVPAIVHRGRVVTECAAICAYLADTFPEAGLAPPADERGAYYRWLFFAAGPLEAATMDHYRNIVPEGQEKQMAGYGSWEETIAALAGAVGGQAWIAGSDFSAADAYAGSQLDWLTQFGMIRDQPAIAAYVERLRARPAYQRARDIDRGLVEAAEAPSSGGEQLG